MILFFPGQGSQFVGMGKELSEKYSIAKIIYEQANDILGIDIQKISFEGPENQLLDTKNTQPAILIYQHILTTLLKEKNIEIDGAAGHSLGEFSALLAAEMLSFEDTLKLVRKRGELMSNTIQGAMAVVLGLDDDKVITICNEISQKAYVEPVNFNTPGQIVISGLNEGIKLAEAKLLEAGAKRVMPLAVSGAFHSKLMTSASEEFKLVVDQLTFNQPLFPIVSNVTASFYDNTEAKLLLPLQIKSPVQWVKTIQFLSDQGFTSGVEVSNSNTISGMVKKINKEFTMENVLTLLG